MAPITPSEAETSVQIGLNKYYLLQNFGKVAVCPEPLDAFSKAPLYPIYEPLGQNRHRISMVVGYPLRDSELDFFLNQGAVVPMTRQELVRPAIIADFRELTNSFVRVSSKLWQDHAYFFFKANRLEPDEVTARFEKQLTYLKPLVNMLGTTNIHFQHLPSSDATDRIIIKAAKAVSDNNTFELNDINLQALDEGFQVRPLPADLQARITISSGQSYDQALYYYGFNAVALLISYKGAVHSALVSLTTDASDNRTHEPFLEQKKLFDYKPDITVVPVISWEVGSDGNAELVFDTPSSEVTETALLVLEAGSEYGRDIAQFARTTLVGTPVICPISGVYALHLLDPDIARIIHHQSLHQMSMPVTQSDGTKEERQQRMGPLQSLALAMMVKHLYPARSKLLEGMMSTTPALVQRATGIEK